MEIRIQELGFLNRNGAFYDARTKNIYIDKGCLKSQEYFKFVLIHEVKHLIQFHENKKFKAIGLADKLDYGEDFWEVNKIFIKVFGWKSLIRVMLIELLTLGFSNLIAKKDNHYYFSTIFGEIKMW